MLMFPKRVYLITRYMFNVKPRRDFSYLPAHVLLKVKVLGKHFVTISALQLLSFSFGLTCRTKNIFSFSIHTRLPLSVRSVRYQVPSGVFLPVLALFGMMTLLYSPSSVRLEPMAQVLFLLLCFPGLYTGAVLNA